MGIDEKRDKAEAKNETNPLNGQKSKSSEANKQHRVTAFGVKRQGASHIRDGKPCQDSFKIWNGIVCERNITILAVADGHGSERYDLSQYGSLFAVECGIDIARNIYEEVLGALRQDTTGKKAINAVNLRSEILKALRSFFPLQILMEWLERVLEDLAKREPDIDTKQANDNKNIKRYGTTLLVTLISPEGIFIAQLGDGNILSVNEEGIEAPIPEASQLIGGETFSMVSKESSRLWVIETISIEDKPMMVLMSTDGLANAYSSNQEFFKFAHSFYKNLVEFGTDSVVKALPDYLDNATENGSGDDITLVFAYLQSGT